MSDDEAWRHDMDDDKFNEVDYDEDAFEPIVQPESGSSKVRDKGKRKLDTSSGKVSSANPNSESVEGGSGKTVHLLKSEVWLYFDKMDLKKTDGVPKAKCKKCGKVFKSDASKIGTSNMKRHTQKCQNRVYKDVGQMIFATEKNSVSLENSKFDPVKFRDLLTEAIAGDDLAFRFIERPRIRRVLKYLKPDLHLVSRNTAKSDLMKKYTTLKEKMMKLIGSSRSMICLTSDLWTSCTTDGYICLIAHFVDQDWELRKILLDLSFMEPPHTGRALADRIYDILGKWKIRDKVLSLTLDNASSNDVCVDLLKDKLSINGPLILGGDFFHIRCCAHILNLIVQDGLKEANEVVKKIRDIGKVVRNSQVRKTEFVKNVIALNLEKDKGLRSDCPTRWNSTFLMLNRAIYFKGAIRHTDWGNSSADCPTLSEWAKAEAIATFFRPFYELTMLFSGTKYPTANLYFPLVFQINYSLNQKYEGNHLFMVPMVERMKIKFDKYWSNFSVPLAIANMLDPRYKYKFVQWAYGKMYEGSRGALEARMIWDKLHDMFDTYMEKSSPEAPPLEKNSRGGKRSRKDSCHDQLFHHLIVGGNLLNEFDDLTSSTQATQKSQLERYLEEDQLDRKLPLDVLKYWHGESTRFPVLAAMACDIFSILITTVASESTFSGSGRVISKERSSLGSETVHAIMCTRDWIRLLDSEGSAEEEIDDYLTTLEVEESQGSV